MTKMISIGPSIASVTYECPNVDIPDRMWLAPTGRLLPQLASLCGRQANPHTRKPYEEVRNKFWALNMVLNNNGDTAPRFRPTILVGKPPLSEEEKLLTNDKQVLDLHWLSVYEGLNGPTVTVAPKWKPLFENDLDLKLAALFVATVGRTGNKVDDLMCRASTSLTGSDNQVGRFWPLRSMVLLGVFLFIVDVVGAEGADVVA